MKKTILITGATGYIGSWVTKFLLEKEYNVRITVRDKSKVEKFKFLEEIAEKSVGELEVFEADLLKENSFDEAAKGAYAIMHVASPFTLSHKDAIKDLIEPAVKGTQNVLNAANKSDSVKKVILTSSVAAIHGDNKDMSELGIEEFTEEHYNTSSSVEHQPYSFSKVSAEKEAWKMYEAQNQWELIVINPSFVMGPLLVSETKSGSITFMHDLLSGKFRTGAPELYFGFVDVRDIADAHILALENENAKGRHILCESVRSVIELRDIIEKLYPKKFKLPLMKAPKFLLLIIGKSFGLTNKFVSRNIGWKIKLNNTKSINELGVKYKPLETTVKEMIEKMEENKMI